MKSEFKLQDSSTPWSELEDIVYDKNQFLIIGKVLKVHFPSPSEMHVDMLNSFVHVVSICFTFSLADQSHGEEKVTGIENTFQ